VHDFSFSGWETAEVLQDAGTILEVLGRGRLHANVIVLDGNKRKATTALAQLVGQLVIAEAVSPGLQTRTPFVRGEFSQQPQQGLLSQVFELDRREWSSQSTVPTSEYSRHAAHPLRKPTTGFGISGQYTLHKA